MKHFITIALVVLLACPVAGSVDPDGDQLGVYFDESANEVCADVAYGEMFTAYVIMTNISADEVGGIEFSLCVDGVTGHLVPLSYLWLGLGTPELYLGDLCIDGINHGSPFLVAPLGGKITVLELSYIVLDPVEVNFYLGPASFQTIDDGLPAYSSGESVFPLGISSGDPAVPVATLNGDCQVVELEATTFGNVKALYR